MKFAWKKRLLSVVCAVMAAVMFVGCGSSSSSAAANTDGSAVGSSSAEGGEKERREVTATVMQSRNVPGLQKMIDKLAEEENIVVDLQVVPFPVSWTVKMKKKQKETQDILSYHTQAAGCSDKARAKASGGRQPIEECGRTGL